MSVDVDGNLVERKVTGWHATPLGSRRVFKLAYKSAKHAGNGRVSIQLTGDHEVLTERGWVAAQNLEPADRIATGHGLSELAHDVVCGTLLGDGSFEPDVGQLQMAHSSKQAEYAHFKAELLEELRPVVSEVAAAAVVGGPRVYPAVHVRTRASRTLRTLREEF